MTHHPTLRVPRVPTRKYSVHRMALSQITWQDVQQLPDDGHRYEAIAGELHVTPAPSVQHQRISSRLERALYSIIQDPGLGEVLHAPVGVEFPSTSEGVQPDIVVVSAERSGIVDEDWIRGAPDIVVEILSPTTARRDRGIKLKLYGNQGVSEYWIVDRVARAIDVWRFHGGARCERYTDRLTVRLAGEVLGEIELEPVFKEPGAAAL